LAITDIKFRLTGLNWTIALIKQAEHLAFKSVHELTNTTNYALPRLKFGERAFSYAGLQAWNAAGKHFPRD